MVVRCLIYYKDGQVHTASRGGGHYDYSTSHIIDHPKLIEWFSNNPNVILDGELYKKDVSLQRISGAARMEKDANNEWLEFYLYDIVDVNTVWRDRYSKLQEISEELELTFDPYREWKSGELQIQLVPHEIVQTEKRIWELHDQYVAEGWEGCVVRDPDKVYKPKGRSNDMIKFKSYKAEDFKVVGYELGLRGSEDMVFVCELEDGRTFEAMPVGNREVKAEYVENFDEKYKNHMAECTFFNWSDENKPTQPKLRHFRFDLE